MNSPPPPYGSVESLSSPAAPDGNPWADETTPLNAYGCSKYASRRDRLRGTLVGLLVSLLATLIIVQNAGLISTLADDVPAAQKAMMRELWRRERVDHMKETMQWRHERQDHRQELQLWDLEREDRERDRASWKEQVEAEHQAWKEQVEAEREAWKNMVDAERQAWAREGEEWTRRREEEERHRKDVEWRRQGVHWKGPWKNGGCHEYGVQSYSADLLDIPGDLNWREVCEDMPIQIEGSRYDSPDKCERNEHGNVWATWFVRTNESQCMTYWDRMEDKGCTPGRSGMRRYESRLMNLHNGDDWNTMCNTSPATIGGVHYDRPTVCEDKNGRTGIFDHPDGWCW